jgi:rhodanese-related sulfurtransferase
MQETPMTYAGDMTPSDTLEQLATDPRAVLVDCRTEAEWSYVGLPDLSSIGKPVVTIEWCAVPGSTVNTTFTAQLEEAGIDRSFPVYFLCRSGVRSKAAAAAATAAGWDHAFNISDGFEGPVDVHGHRGTTSGWKAGGLPWRQQ